MDPTKVFHSIIKRQIIQKQLLLCKGEIFEKSKKERKEKKRNIQFHDAKRTGKVA